MTQDGGGCPEKNGDAAPANPFGSTVTHSDTDTALRAFSVLESTIHYYMSTLKDRFHKRPDVGDVRHILSQVTVSNLVFVLTGAKEPTCNHLSLVLDGSKLVRVDGDDVRLIRRDIK